MKNNDLIDQLIEALDLGEETIELLQRQLREAERDLLMAEALAFLGELDNAGVELARREARDLGDALSAERHIEAVRRMALQLLRERREPDPS